MAKRDLKREMRDFYGPSASAVVRVDVPTMNFLMIDGRGDPNSSTDYADAVQALFALSYAVKFVVKRLPARVQASANAKLRPVSSMQVRARSSTANAACPSLR